MAFGKQLLDGLKDGFTSAVSGLPGQVIGFGTGIVGGFVNQAFERKSLDYQAALNEQSAINAYNRQLDFWNKQNAYNDPSAQVNRLRRAGLNPALINANGVNNVAGSLSSVPASSAGSPGGNRVNPSAEASVLADYAYKLKQMGFLDTQTSEVMERILSIQVERGIKALEKELKLTEAEKASLDYTEMYEALYGKSIDGGEPTIVNNRYKTEVDEARSRIRLNESQQSLAEAEESYAKAMEEYQRNTDSREAALNLAQIAATRASAQVSLQLAKKYENDINLANNEDARAEARLILDQEMHDLLIQIHASEAEILKAQEWLNELWNKDADTLMREFKVGRDEIFRARWRDFIHNNLRLGGNAGANISKK